MNKMKLRINIWMLVILFCALGFLVYYYIPNMFADEVVPLQYSGFIVKYSNKYGVDPALVAAVIMQESRFNPGAKSFAGAQGLMQFMPGTAATMAKETGRWPKYDIFDAETSVEFGAAHLRDLLAIYKGNTELALYAYNTGTGSASFYISNPGAIANFSYVKKVLNYKRMYQAMYATELNVEPIKIDKKSSNAEVRGFVWSQIFANFVETVTGSNK